MSDFSFLNFEQESLKKHYDSNIEMLDSLEDYYTKTVALGAKISKVIAQFDEKPPRLNDNKTIYIDIKEKILSQMEINSVFFNSINAFFYKLKEDVCSSIKNFKDEISAEYNTEIKSFSLLARQINDKKDSLTKSQKKYFKECQKLEEMEKKVSENIFSQTDIVNQATDDYNAALKETNKYFSEINEKYLKNYEARCQRETKLFEFLKKITKQISDIQNEIMPKPRKSPFWNYSTEVDIEKFREQIAFTDKEKRRIQKEEFLTFETYQSTHPNNAQASSSIMTYFGGSLMGTYIATGTDFIDNPELEFSSQDDESSSTSVMSNTQTILTFIKSIIGEKEIDFDLSQEFKSRLKTKSFVMSFIDNYFKFERDKFTSYSNENNLRTMSAILNSIIVNFNLGEEDVKLFHLIVVMSERSYYKEKSKTGQFLYLCSVLSKNDLFKSKQIWFNLFRERLVVNINYYVSMLQKKEKKTRGIFGKISNIFTIDTNDYNIRKFELDELLTGYNSLSPESKELLDKNFYSFLTDTIKEMIEHLSNFCYEKIYEFVIALVSEYEIRPEQVNFCVDYLFYMNLTGRKVDDGANKETKSKIKDIIKKNDEGILLKYPCNIKKNKEKNIILNNCSKYLTLQEFVPFFTLNKEISKKFRKNCFERLLNDSNKDFSKSIRLQIWKTILNIQNFNSSFDYEKFLKEAKEQEKTKDINTIILDAQRTNFISNPEKSRQAIINILTAMFYVNPTKQYYQGMNYIATFLYKICNESEKDAFAILYSLLTNTEYNSIFNKDMKKLKTFFAVFEHLLKLKLPSIYYYFVSHEVSVHYYVGPWIITLFTNTIQHCKESYPLILFNIWDEFLLKGWKSLLGSIIALISIHIQDIEEKKDDYLLSFLINDLAKSEKFSDKYFDTWINEKKKFKIKNKTISSIEKIIEFEKENQ